MMCSWSTLKLFLTIFVLHACTPECVNAQRKLQISIYYESLCPDSVRFITQQLYPIYQDIKSYVNIMFVPFGKSYSINGGESFWCQHGENECFGNTIQSCALYSLGGNIDGKMEFVNCQMTYGAEPTGKLCAGKVGIAWEEINQCYHGGLGTRLQLEAERKTQQIKYPYPSFVPTIVYDYAFNQDLQDRSQTQFKNVLCELMSNALAIC